MVGTSPNAPIAMIADEKRKFYATQFHLEVVHTPHGAALLRNFVRKIAQCRGDWTMRAFKDEAIEKIREQVGKGRVICGLSGGVDSRGRRGADPRGDRRPAHLRVRRSRPAAAGRRREGRRPVPRPLQHPAGARRRLGARSSARSTGVTDPETEAQDHRQAVHRRVRGRGEEDRRRRIPGAGHALSRRDRERVVHRRAVGHHQVAPQCRRPARAHEHEAGRAAARAVQGRGARARPRARPARGVRRPPSVPGAGPRDPLPRRDHAREARHPAARRRRSISTRSARPASTTRSGRRSR